MYLTVAASIGTAACQSRIVSSELLAPSSMFSLTRVKGSDMGTDWERTDIYVHQRADSQYVGTVASAARGVRPVRQTDLAMSADGRTILFCHQSWHATGRPSLEPGVYRYVYGEGAARLTVPKQVGPVYDWRIGTRPGLLPQDVLTLYVNDTMWVATIAGDVSPLILFEATPLHRAAFEGRTNDCATLVRDGASLNDTTRWGHTALDLAIIGKHDETAIRLLELGARTPARASAGSLAASLGRIPVVEAMFARGLDANAVDQRGNTLLHVTLASLWRDATVPGLLTAVQKPESLIAHDVPRTLMRLLLDRGADANVRNASGKTPLAVATSKCC